LHRRTQIGARPPINFGGLKTTQCALGGDAWRMNQKNYFMLACWLWHCAATAVALQMHEGVNAFNLVLIVVTLLCLIVRSFRMCLCKMNDTILRFQ